MRLRGNLQGLGAAAMTANYFATCPDGGQVSYNPSADPGGYMAKQSKCAPVAPVSAAAPAPVAPAPVAPTTVSAPRAVSSPANITYNISVARRGADRVQPLNAGVRTGTTVAPTTDTEVLIAEEEKPFPWWILAAGTALLLGQ